MQQKQLNWIAPLHLARKIAQNFAGDFVFLHSALNQEIPASKSLIALFKNHEITPQNLSELKPFLAQNQDSPYFGYVSYEYKNHLEKFSKTKKSPVNLAQIRFAKYDLIFEFDHEKQILTAFFTDKNQLKEVLSYQEQSDKKNDIKINKIASNFSSDEYILTIEKIRKRIASGEFYQTNLTRKFFGKMTAKNHFAIFEKLSAISPANFSSFIKNGDEFIISASPELFLQISDKKIISRPIKGTSARFKDRKKDEESKNYLLASQKEKAENLMIVDLVRNDLSRVCAPSSIEVKNLFAVNSYSTLHHLSSEIHGKIDEEKDAIDAFEACFPAGSMTGAPKIKAIKAVQFYEKLDRGVYSGAIGYFKGLDEAIFSVVIRTLICKKDDFEFQVGGAITFDSDAKKELEEIFVKARGIVEVLGVELERVGGERSRIN